MISRSFRYSRILEGMKCVELILNSNSSKSDQICKFGQTNLSGFIQIHIFNIKTYNFHFAILLKFKSQVVILIVTKESISGLLRLDDTLKTTWSQYWMQNYILYITIWERINWFIIGVLRLRNFVKSNALLMVNHKVQ